MADRTDLDFTYSLTDRIIRLSLGEQPDFSGAMFDGDFALSLEQAQQRKHEYVAQQGGIGPGRRLLDLGCGWGPLLAFAWVRGGAGVFLEHDLIAEMPGRDQTLALDQTIREATLPDARVASPEREGGRRELRT